MNWEKLAQRATKIIEQRMAADPEYRFTIEQNNALAGYTPDPTHQIEQQDNAMQNAGVWPQRIPSEIIR